MTEEKISVIIKRLTKILFIYPVILTFGSASAGIYLYYTGNTSIIASDETYKSFGAVWDVLEVWKTFRNIGLIFTLLLVILASINLLVSKNEKRVRTFFFTLGKSFLIFLLLVFSYPFGAVMASSWLNSKVTS